MKLFITIALCVVATMALPVDEIKVAQNEAQVILELEPTVQKNIEEALRVKRQFGGL